MALDVAVPLAFSVFSNKGIYAVLLGSGVSRTAAIPTGWEVVLDLTRKLAHVLGESCEPDPEGWFRAKFDRHLDYSKLLDQLTRTAAERQQLLRSYFEPTDEERKQGLKSPTAAHKAIAQLMKAGYVRVAVTTNFDRLLEQALSAAGVEPTVISNADSALGAVPLTHCPCTLIKANGDYLDSRLRNTARELEKYDRPLARLLDRVFDEFGLIVCGWSGTSDTALRGCMQRCSARRFPAYWAVKGPLQDDARRLIQLRGAVTFDIAGADEFFTDLADRVAALEQYAEGDTVSRKVALTRAKRYLSSDEYRIQFSDLIYAETEKVFREMNGKTFPMQAAQFGANELLVRIQNYQACAASLLDITMCAAHWGQPQHDEAIVKSFRRISADAGADSGLNVWLKLRRYPALLLLYGAGLAAIASDNYRLVAKLLLAPVRHNRHRDADPAAVVMHHNEVLDHNLQRHLPGREREHTPLCNHLFEFLRKPARQYLPDDLEYESAFDWFEYLLALVYADCSESWSSLKEADDAGEQPTAWGPIGCFGWRHRGGDRSVVSQTELRNGEPLPAKVGAVLKAGMFGGRPDQYDRFRYVKRAFDQHLSRCRMR